MDEAIKAYKNAREDKKFIGLLMLMGSTEYIIHHFEVKGDTAYGYNEKREKLVEVPITEPIQLRVLYDKERDVARRSIT